MAPSTPEPGTEAKLVLLADDHADSVAGYELLLRSHGYRTAVALDGPQAIEQARRLRPDLILLDLGLPGLSGWEVLQRLRADTATAATPVVVVTGHLFPQDIAHAEAAGCSAILPKPCDAEALLEAARTWTGGPAGRPG
jgi:CheY-like chemotaxis protein